MDQSDGHAAVRGRLCSTGKVNSASLFSVDSSCTFVLTNYDFIIFFFQICFSFANFIDKMH